MHEWTVFKFVEHIENNEKPADQKSKIKFKIMSLKVKGGVEYVPELVSFMALVSRMLVYICHSVSLKRV